MTYLFILFYLVFLIYQYDIRGLKQKFKLHFWLLFLLMSLMSGLSYRLGIDVLRYEESFNWLSPNWDFYEFFGENMFYSGKEPLWLFLNMLVKKAFGYFYVLKLIVALFVNGSIFWFLRRHSQAFFFSILLYFVFSFAALNFQVLRESLAVGFFLIALDNIIDGKNNFLKYYLWLIPATFCHHFAFIAGFFPLLFFVKYNRAYVFVLVLVMIASPFISNLLSNYLPYDLLGDGVTQRVDIYLNSEKRQRNVIRLQSFMNNIIVNILPIILLLVYNKKTLVDKRCQCLLLSFLIVKLMDITVLGIMYRLTNYLMFPSLIIFAHCFKEAIAYHNFSHVKVGIMANRTVANLVVAFLLTTAIYNKVSSVLWPMYYPYSSVITKSTDETRESLYILMNQY